MVSGRKVWVDGKPQPAHVDKQARKARRNAKRALEAQGKQASIAAKYGKRGRPGPVLVRYLDGQEPARVVDQSQITSKRRSKMQP